jgi:hypothetical protein
MRDEQRIIGSEMVLIRKGGYIKIEQIFLIYYCSTFITYIVCNQYKIRDLGDD